MLIERLERATGPDREIDLAIHIAVEPGGEIAKIVASHPRGFESREGIEWEFTGSQQTLCWHRHDASGHCWSNGGLPMPHYTSSLDAAMTLVPDGWAYQIRMNVSRDGDEAYCNAQLWPFVGNGDPEDSKPNIFANHDRDKPAIALCIACLRARP